MTKMLGNLQTRLKTKQQQNLKNKMEKIIHLLMFNYIFAIISIIFGIWKLRDTIKNTTRDTNSALQPFFKWNCWFYCFYRFRFYNYLF